MRLGSFLVFHFWLSGNSRYSVRPGISFESNACTETMSRMRVRLISVLSFHAVSGRIFASCENTVSTGVFIFDDALISSSNLGTPSVTFLALLPALWNVLRVICVVGSPTDCAAMVPTISPAATMLPCHFLSNMSQIFCRASSEHGSAFLAKMAST